MRLALDARYRGVSALLEQPRVVVRPVVNVTVCVDGPAGRRIERGHNLVVNAGLDLHRDWAYGDAPAGLASFAIGTSGTAAAPGDTALGAQVLLASITSRTKGAQQITLKYFLSPPTANGNTLREAGLFTGSSVLFARYVLVTPIIKTVAISVTWVWDITWGPG